MEQSEIVSLRAPYQDLLHPSLDSKKSKITWRQVLELTKTSGLRPTLPDHLEEAVSSLICDCWHEDPDARPSFSVVLLRLQEIGIDAQKKAGSQKQSSSISHESIRNLCHDLHDLFWRFRDEDWDEERVFKLIAPDLKVGAVDPVLNQVLAVETGPAALRSLARIMCSKDDDTKIVPEPLLDDDIVRSLKSSHVLLRTKLVVHEVSSRQKRGKPTRFQHRREFASLEQALAEAATDGPENAMNHESISGEGLRSVLQRSQAVKRQREASISARKKPVPRRLESQDRERRPHHHSISAPMRDPEFELFLQATRQVLSNARDEEQR